MSEQQKQHNDDSNHDKIAMHVVVLEFTAFLKLELGDMYLDTDCQKLGSHHDNVLRSTIGLIKKLVDKF